MLFFLKFAGELPFFWMFDRIGEIVEKIAAEWKWMRDAIVASFNCVALARQIGDLAAGWR